MDPMSLEQMERNIARCRVVLSLAALLVVFIDPQEPQLARWIPWVSGAFRMDPRLFLVMAAHLVYSIVLYARDPAPSHRTTMVTTWVDVAFALAIGMMTTGVTGPSYPFLAFAVVVTGLRGGFRQTMMVTTISLALYTLLIVVSTRGGADVYIMRPVYLGITGYVVGYLGQQRLDLQEEMRQLEVAEQRHRIARDLHDNYAQALAGIDLRLESARRLLRAGGVADALGDLTALQESVKREFDDLRQYARTLAGVEPTPALPEPETVTRVELRTEVTASVALVEHVLGIVRESLSNIRRHARARRAVIRVDSDAEGVHIWIDDDGIGFDGAVTPWSITSRVKEIGGRIEIGAANPGAHLSITLPRA